MQADSFDPMSLYDFGVENLDPNITYAIEAQEIFEIGTHKGVPYDGHDNKTIVANFKRFYNTKPHPLLMPPAVIGHEEDQEVLKRSDLPAAGWVTACFITAGTKLAVNVGEMPALVMYWIKTGKIRTVSAEIYDDSGEAGLPPGFGPTLRRIAFLGGDIPQVKSLARLKVPVPEEATARQFSERRVRVYSMPVSKNLRYFAEVKTMSQKKNPKLFDDMKADGIDDDTASKMSDMSPDMLRKMSDCLKKYADSLAPPAADPAAGQTPGFDRAAAIELIASKNGIDRATLESKTDDELKQLMGPASMSDSQEDPTKLSGVQSTALDARTEDTTGGSGASANANAISQGSGKKLTSDDSAVKNSEGLRKHSEGANAMMTDIETRMARQQARLDEQERREKIASLKRKQAKVNKFSEDAIKEGKITPAELNAGFKDLLMAADDETVRKFSDGSSATALDKMISAINARPKLNIFSEKMPGSRDESARERDAAEAKRLMTKTESGRKALARETAKA